MEPERAVHRLPSVAVTDADREHAVELLQRATGEGRLTLDEFSTRAGVAWETDDRAALAELTAGLAEPPPVGTSQPLAEVTAIFSEHKQGGKWRLPRRLRIRSIFGSAKLDLREATISAESLNEGVVDIHARVLFGECKITVPQGVEVEMYGSSNFGTRHLDLDPVPRRAGTPIVRIHAKVWFGELRVRSAPPGVTGTFARWLHDMID